MLLSESDWKDVMEHTRRRVREAGLGDVDRRVTLDFQSTQDPQTDFVRYLSYLIKGLREKSLYGYKRALQSLREGLELDGGREIEGIRVICVDGDSRLYGVDSINLNDVEDLNPLIKELESLQDYLRRNGVFCE